MTVPTVGYHTHILIGVEATGSMTVIWGIVQIGVAIGAQWMQRSGSGL